MPVISFNKKYLYGLIGSGIDDAKLADQVSKLGFEVEQVDNDNISVEITANRLDLLDAVGFARAIKNFMHRSKRFHYEIENQEPEMELTVEPSVKKIRPFISALVVHNINMDEHTLLNIVNFSEKFCETYGRNRRKIAMGFHDLAMIKPPIVYKSGEDIDYVPLGKNSPMRLSEVLDKEEKGKQYANILRNARTCYYPVLSDSQGVMAFIPILNSQRTRITTATKDLFIDITGTSEYAVNKVAELLAASFIDMEAQVRKVKVVYGERNMVTPEMQPRYVELKIEKAEMEIGVKIGYNNVISLANKMGYEAAMLQNNIRFRIPEYRMDVIDEQDVIEDIAIGYGYQYINPIPMYFSQQGTLEDRTKVNKDLAIIMLGFGFTEFANSYLTNQSTNFEKPGIKMDKSEILLRNSKTEAITMMRTWIIPSLMNNLGMSAHEKMPQDIFEIDMVFRARNRKPIESYHLAAVSINPKANFNDIKAVVEGIMFCSGMEYSIKGFMHESFIEGRCAEIIVDGNSIGFFGEIHPRVLKNFGIEEPGIGVEIELEPFYPRS